MLIKSIREALAGRAVATVSPNATIEHATQAMEDHRVDAIVVLDNRTFVGLLTEADVIRHASQHGGFKVNRVKDVMRTDLDCIETRDSFAQAIERLKSGGQSHLPVLDLGQDVVGVLSMNDIPLEYRMTKLRLDRSVAAARA